MALITAAQARLAIPGLTGTGEDTNIETVISRVGAAFARWCGYPPASAGASPTMETTSYTLYSGRGGLIDILDGRFLRVNIWPVTAVSAIYDDPQETYGTAITSTYYAIVDGNQGLIGYTVASGLGWIQPTSENVKNIKIACSAGFSTVPGDLAGLAVMAVKHWWDLRHVQGRTSVVAGSNNASLRDEDLLPAVVRQGLAPLRLPRAWL